MQSGTVLDRRWHHETHAVRTLADTLHAGMGPCGDLGQWLERPPQRNSIGLQRVVMKLTLKLTLVGIPKVSLCVAEGSIFYKGRWLEIVTQASDSGVDGGALKAALRRV